MLHQRHLKTQKHTWVLPDSVGGVHVGQEHHGYLSNTVVGGHELHDNLPVTVDVVKLDQEPIGSLADVVGVEPHGDLPD